MIEKTTILLAWLLLVAIHPAQLQTTLWEFELPTDRTTVRKWLGTKAYEINRSPAADWAVDAEKLTMSSDDASYEIKIEFPQNISSADNPVIEFKYKVLEAPAEANLRLGNLEDSAFRIYLGFDKLNWCRVPNSIVYAHGSSNSTGARFNSGRFCLGNVYFHIVNDSTSNDWISVRKNIYLDYESVFRGKLPELMGLMIKTDSNNSGGKSRVMLNSIRIISTPTKQ